MVLKAGTTTLNGFNVGNKYALQASGGVVGVGRGAGGSLLAVADHTMSAKSRHWSGGTNPLYVVRTTSKSRVVVANIAITGGAQGALYNGVRVEKTRGAIVHDVRIFNVPGNSDVPPGETFALNMWQVIGPVVHDSEFDGGGIGASGVGYNSSTGGSTVRVTAHDLRFCKGLAFWQHQGGHVIDQFQTLNNAFGIGFERCSGVYTIQNVKFRGSTRADLHVANDQGRGQFHIIDPDLGSKGHLTVLLPPTEMKKPNKQQRSDVTLTINGKLRNDLLHFVSKA